MPLTTDKIHIQHLVAICRKKGLKNIILSPGSRNAPLTIAFDADDFFNIEVIVDERVAAFYALGKAQQTKTAVILICTSGTALLNYAPGVAEAYYQHIPLLILSADRPEEWIDQGAGQSIRQKDVYQNFIRASYSLPQSISEGDKSLWYSDRLVNEAINKTSFPIRGPVHINIPLAEPLYNQVVQKPIFPKIQNVRPARLGISDEVHQLLKSEWTPNKKRLIFCSAADPHALRSTKLAALQEMDDVVIWTENLSNVSIQNQMACVDRFIESVGENEWENLRPDILLTIGSAVVSKKLRFLIRALRPLKHWHVSDEIEEVDRYMSLNETIHAKAERLIDELIPEAQVEARPFQGNWHLQYISARERHDEYLTALPFCDLKAFEVIMKRVPEGMLQLGNSTVVRYSQLFEQRKDLVYYANRGTSGIDGSGSTAMGAASLYDGNCTFITGDLSFLYDSNALWSHILPKNLKIIVINNGGGSIFKFIQGPSSIKKVDEYFVTNHDVRLKAFIQSMGWKALIASDVDTLQSALETLYGSDYYQFLIVDTSKKENELILKNYFKYLKA